jgi:N utilization substance protein B
VRLLAEQDEVRRFAFHHIQLYLDHAKEINGLIDRASQHWKVERLALVDANILRMTLAEMLFESSVPVEVAIDEAVELTKKYGSEESPKFVNGVLAGLVPMVRARRQDSGPQAVVGGQGEGG